MATHQAGRRVLLLGGMAGFFVLALAIPRSFSTGGPALGLSYLVVVVVHATLFGRATAVEAMTRIAPLNVLAALSVLVGLWIGGTTAYVALAVAIVLTWGVSARRSVTGFDVGPSHFAERHGLVVIIAIGESVVSVGVPITQHGLDAGLALSGLLGLALSAALWWTYFGGDNEQRTEQALAATTRDRRPRVALDGFGLWHWLLLLGIVVAATGLKAVAAAPLHVLATAPALFLAGGVAAFLAADAGFRAVLGWSVDRVRWPATALVAATALLGIEVAAAAELGALVIVLAAMLVADEGRRRIRERRPENLRGRI